MQSSSSVDQAVTSLPPTGALGVCLDVVTVLAEQTDPEAALRGVLEALCVRLELVHAAAYIGETDGPMLSAEWPQSTVDVSLIDQRETGSGADLPAAVSVPIVTATERLGLLVLRPRAERSRALICETASLVGARIGAPLRRMQREETRRNAGLHAEALLQHLDEAVLLLDDTGRIVAAGGATVRVLGRSALQLVGTPLSLFYVEADQMLDLPIRHLESASASPRMQVDGWRVRADGERFWAKALMRAVQADGGGPPCFVVVIEDDSAAHLKMDSERAETTELMRSNHDLELFALVASHDLQEPLRKIRVFSDRIRRRAAAPLDEAVAEGIGRIDEAAERMQQLIDDLLAYARLALRERARIAINIQDLLRKVASDQIDIDSGSIALDVAGLPVFRGDRVLLEQLFRNLLSNASKFRRQDELLKIVIAGRVLADSTIEVSVFDNGIGFEPQYNERIFGMLQRLHGRGRYAGSGMGLAICRRIAERHGGAICAHGDPGNGARFTITLPLNPSL